ncbi:HutD family protein [Paraburkholderia nodosa]|uniref:HutD family protein n=1 Tax=Paraburkholderia nodosa TaxID=392320 RepID=UPI00210B9CDB|nr:HutD family protein [Paraburkholderia nodosa]
MIRVSLVVAGAGVTLDNGPTRVDLQPGHPSEYDGDAEWHASLHDGSIVKLNAMVTRGRYTARIVPLRATMHVPSGCIALVLTLRGASILRTCRGGKTLMLREAHVATRLADGEAFEIEPARVETQNDAKAHIEVHAPHAALVIIERATCG